MLGLGLNQDAFDGFDRAHARPQGTPKATSHPLELEFAVIHRPIVP
jgi:hypothetical protein